ncbi:hypothetical protein TPB0596_10100 [Tsukamurella pulmonis]|uniref:hypothetical protein n=1 Tax=Tsukamurella pulmonis TaxID=47312 RepID=UPI001EDEA6B0|nr:hypothetical protein [Tsukamurella pulmonis]BDD81247.1 hypothetical protein TPB0596_10100 [Tsukamurella pulmonis]
MTNTKTAYLYARILLGVSVLLSLACNAAHAYLNAAEVPLALSLGVGAIPPLVLALSVEAVVFCSRHAAWSWGWAAVTAASGAGLVTGFCMSFAAISDLGRMAHMSPITAPMLPIGIDALVITGLGMVALFRPRVQGADQSADHKLISADQPLITGPDQPISEPITLDRTVDLPLIGAGHEGDQPGAGELHQVTTEHQTEAPMHLVEPAADPHDDQVDPHDEHLELAELIAATGRTNQSISVITAVLAARAARKGQKAAGLAAGVSQGTVRHIEKLAGEVAA